MGRQRRLNEWNQKTRKWVLRTPQATETSYLGGLTMPSVTKRPHMGPFNRVTNYKISDADEVYRRHDIGYGKELAKGRSPYTRWNKYDQELMDAPARGWPDYVAKAAFGAKRFFTYGFPEVKGTTFKQVSGKSYPKTTAKRYPTYTDTISGWQVNDTDATVVMEGGGIDPDVLELQRMEQAERRGRVAGWDVDTTDVDRQENSQQITRQNAKSSGNKFHSKIRYGYY